MNILLSEIAKYIDADAFIYSDGFFSILKFLILRIRIVIIDLF